MYYKTISNKFNNKTLPCNKVKDGVYVNSLEKP